jgi:hypothetical protein
MDTNTNSSDSQGLTSQQVVEILQNGTIEAEHGMMRWSSNYTFLLSINHNQNSLMAVYKPQKGERPLWDFPDGMLCKREMASFLTSELLQWQIVPPTVLRQGPHGLGSMQFFIEHDPELNYFEFDEDKLPQMRQICAFDILVNNADRKGGHCLVDSQGHVWGIDHGITFNSSPKLRTVVWDFAGEPIEDFLLEDIERLCTQIDNQKSDYRQALNELITEREIHAFQHRIQHLLKSRKYPQPGPGGPNYPWPPV